jgi:hypothetical protein
MLVEVEGWTVKKEFDERHFELYPLRDARRFTVPGKINDEPGEQEWYDTFVEPTKEAMRLDGKWDVRDRV